MSELYVYAKTIFIQYLVELINQKAKVFEKIIDQTFIDEDEFNILILKW